MQLIDIGVNLTHQSLLRQIDEVIQNAQDAGVIHQIITGTCMESSLQALEIATTYPGYFSTTAGFHPHDAKDFKYEDTQRLLKLAENPFVVAIGECGLDFNRNYSPQDVQKTVFEDQIEIACKVNLPLFMHQRDAHQQFIEILSQYQGRYKNGVVHCFTGDKQQLKQCLDLGLYIGITGWICDKRRNQELLEAIRYLPMDRILVETDAPYLMPANITPKLKSRTNVPANLPWVVKHLAKALTIDPETVAKETTNNAREFFCLSV